MKNLDLKNNTEEKNIIERTKEVREIAKKIKTIYDDYVCDSFLAMRDILSFLTLPYRTRFIEDYHCDEEMLVNESRKITVPSLYFTDGNEFLYTAWCCKIVEEGKKVLKEYRNYTEKMYRYLFDYIVIENIEERDEIIERVGKGLEKLEELAHNKVLDELFYTRQEIWNVQSRLWNEKIIDDKTEFITREKAIEYTIEVAENTIKRFPEILKQDLSKKWKMYNSIDTISYYELDFDDVEHELWEEVLEEAESQK